MKQIYLNEQGDQIVYWNEDGEGYTQAQLDYYEAQQDLATHGD
jgi:hypothetical protein